ILDTDASAVAIAGILHQVQLDEAGTPRTRVVSYGSRALHGAEVSYAACKPDLLALVYFSNHFRQYLLGRKFLVRVDNQALVWLKTYSGDRTGQMVRWMQQLSEFHFAIDHRQRSKHTNADGLSKCAQYYLDAFSDAPSEAPLPRVPFLPDKQWRALKVFDKNSLTPGHRK
ncbi:MAG: hypothetical protein GY813_15735, partial [Halieaceae bacterium]|nr:hypothetical protein [Halieaceae bacterium]